MKESKILEGNKLIAEFMGWGNVVDYISEIEVYHRASPSCSSMFIKFPVLLYNFKYNESWDWLMPVVEKIESLGYALKIIQNNCFIYGSTMGDHTEYFKNVGYGESKLESTWLTVVEFIKWYNEQTKE